MYSSMKPNVSNAGGGVPPVPGSGAPDNQAKEKLAIYVYEYLVHSGAQKSAATFLEETWRDKSIRISSPPGFLQAWWSVFWDLYSAAPEHREELPSSSEARAMYDYGMIGSGYPAGPSPGGPGVMPGMPPGGPPDGMGPQGPGGPMPLQGGIHPAFFAAGPGGVPVNAGHLRPGVPPQQQLIPRGYPQLRPTGVRLGGPGSHPGHGGGPIPGPHPPFTTAPGGHQSLFPGDGMPPSGMMPPGNQRFPLSGPGGLIPVGVLPHRMQLMQGAGNPGGPPSVGPPNAQHMPGGPPQQDNFRSWQPGGNLSPSLPTGITNGPPPATTPIIPSPQNNTLPPPRSVGTPGPGSVPQNQQAPPSGADVPTSLSLSPDYMPTFPSGASGSASGQPGGSGGPEEESEAIMRIKERLGEEAKHFEHAETPGGGGGGEYFMS